LSGARRPEPAADETRTRSDVRVLAVGETLTWAGLFYLFPALLPHWERSLGWSKTTLSGAFTLALVCSALAAPFAGRAIDRGHGRALLAGSAFTGALLVGALAVVDAVWQFYVLWAGIGLAMSCALYEPCFAHLTHRLGAASRRAITTVTLFAGFAGTVSFPSAHLLAERYGWRGAVLGMGAVVAFVAAPMLWVGARVGEPTFAPAPVARTSAGRDVLRRAIAKPAFWLLAASFALVALTHGILITHLLPMLGERGLAAGTAVLVASLIGPMQVLGRVVMVAVEQRVSIHAVCAGSFVCTLIGIAALYGVAAVPLLAFAFVVVHGAGYGVTSITRPVVTAEHLGREGFGAISGAQATMFMGASALAPTAAALLWERGGYDLALIAGAVLTVAGLTSFTLVARGHRT